MSLRSRYLWACLGLIVLLNLAVLAAVAWNRQAPFASQLSLSPRELTPLAGGYQHDRKRLPSLRLNYRWPQGAQEQLSTAQLTELGFDPLGCRNGRYRWASARDALLVLEFNGPVYQQELAQAKQRLSKAEARLKQPLRSRVEDLKALKAKVHAAQTDYHALLHERSRLLAVALGQDAQELRSRYPDASRYAIVKAQVQPYLRQVKEAEAASCTASVSLANGRLNLPRQLLGGAEELAASFSAEVAFGRNFEPWLVRLEALQ